MLAREESGTQEVESPFAVDGYSHAVAEHLWVAQSRLTHAVLHQAGIGTVHHCRGEQRATSLTWTAQSLHVTMAQARPMDGVREAVYR